MKSDRTCILESSEFSALHSSVPQFPAPQFPAPQFPASQSPAPQFPAPWFTPLSPSPSLSRPPCRLFSCLRLAPVLSCACRVPRGIRARPRHFPANSLPVPRLRFRMSPAFVSAALLASAALSPAPFPAFAAATTSAVCSRIAPPMLIAQALHVLARAPPSPSPDASPRSPPLFPLIPLIPLNPSSFVPPPPASPLPPLFALPSRPPSPLPLSPSSLPRSNGRRYTGSPPTPPRPPPTSPSPRTCPPRPTWTTAPTARTGAGTWSSAAPTPLPPTGLHPPPAAAAHPNRPGCVRGTDAGNLALTRVAQRDIWASQFPPANCSGRRLLVAPWPHAATHPIGAQLLVATAYLSMAMHHNRTLVMLPGSFSRANHSACKAVGQEGSFDCYFLPMTAQACTDRAVAAMAATAAAAQGAAVGAAAGAAEVGAAPAAAPAAAGAGVEEVVVVAEGGSKAAVLASEQAVVLLNDTSDRDHCDAVRLWGSPHCNRPSVVELAGKMHPLNEPQLKLRWWQAQALRFLLRWPSLHLCQTINRMRHSSYGLSVASQVAAVTTQRAAIIAALASNNVHPAYASMRMNGSDEAKFLQSFNFSHSQSLEADVWPGEGFEGCYQYKGPGPARVDRVYEAVGREVFMMRPVVGLHVRQVEDAGSKASVRSLAGFMFSLYGMRKHVPSLSHVWLSSRLQLDIEHSKQFSDWNFLHSDHPRQSAPQAVTEYEKQVGLQVSVGASLANLLVAAESDYFVGTLNSDWSRLIDALRSTNGRLFAGFVAVEEW
ncbi:unnamed protein product [Closterium sp. Naga37s-1]|nr:unnamed protein product [Closterium sp. Naga37s-1]